MEECRKYKVELTYFRESGKYYCHGEYEAPDVPLYHIWSQVMRMKDNGNLPGLVRGANEFHVLINVPGHPHDHPHLIPIYKRRTP